jgi:O-antigen/teichoic acid export membrane protein
VKTKLIQNLSSHTITQVFTVFVQILSVPIFLSLMGVDMYGEYIILGTIPGFLVLGEVGFGTVINNETVFRISKKRFNDANVLISSSIILLFCIYNTIALLIFLLFFYLDQQFLYITNYDQKLLLFIFWIGGFVSILFGIFQSYLRAQNYYHLNVYWTGFSRLIELILPIVVLLISKNLFYLFLSCVVFRIFSFYFFLRLIKRKTPWFSFKFTLKNNYNNFKPYISKSLHYFLFTFGQGLLVQGSTYLVGNKLGNTSVVQFNTIRTLLNSCKFLLGIINSSFLPEFTKLYALSKNKLFEIYYYLSIHLTFIITIPIVLILTFFGEEIILIWTNDKVEVDKLFFYLMIVQLVFYSIWFVSSNLIVSINEHKKISRDFAFTSLGFLIMAFFLIDILDLSSIPILLIIMDVILIFSVQKSIKNKIGISFNFDKFFNINESFNLAKDLIKKK